MIKDCKKRKCLLPIETLGSDKRFYIEEKDVRRICANLYGGGYSVVFVYVGSILRFLDGKITTLYETDVYPYLSRTDEGKNKYLKYCETYPSYFRNETNYKNLIDEMKEQNYDIKKGAIVIDDNNFILDGQHRSCILLNKYGPFHKVQVVKIYTGRHKGKKMLLKLSCAKINAWIRCCIEYVKLNRTK